MVNGSKSARRYQVKTSDAKHSGDKSGVRFQTLNMSASSGSGGNNHVATQNNVMMNSVAVDASSQNPYPWTIYELFHEHFVNSFLNSFSHSSASKLNTHCSKFDMYIVTVRTPCLTSSFCRDYSMKGHSKLRQIIPRQAMLQAGCQGKVVFQGKFPRQVSKASHNLSGYAQKAMPRESRQSWQSQGRLHLGQRALPDSSLLT